jgi:O-antigen/teichoic acid export membrane protein
MLNHLKRYFGLKSLNYALLLICIASWGPLYRALLDKLWMIEGGIVTVGHWAQLQTLIEFIASPISAGIAVGLSIAVAQGQKTSTNSILLSAYLLSLITILPFLLLLIIFSENVSIWVGLETGYQTEIILCAIGGYLSIATVLINGLFIGQNQQGKALMLMAITGLPIVVMLAMTNVLQLNNPIMWILFTIITVGIGSNLWLLSLLRRNYRNESYSLQQVKEWIRKMAKFAPAGLSIGLLSPLCVLLTRSMLAQEQSWEVAGTATALWRASDWVLSSVQTILYFHFLPLLSKDALLGKMNSSIQKITIQIMLPSATFLILLIVFRNPILHLLYDEQLNVSLEIALLFWFGDAARILSAIFLMALFVLHATKIITVWDFFSQPLFVLLLFIGMDASLRLTGMAYLITYLIYFALCIGAFIYIEKRQKISGAKSLLT